MSYTQEKAAKSEAKHIESLITQAMKKIGAKRESDLCRFLPGPSGGYMHHFTLRKMKTQAPERLIEMLSKHIVHSDKPSNLPPKQRAARGSRKKRDQLVFSKHDLERMLTMARQAGDKDMVRKLTPRKDLRTIKRDLISSIRHGHVELDLWNLYVEAVNAQATLSLNGMAALPVGALA